VCRREMAHMPFVLIVLWAMRVKKKRNVRIRTTLGRWVPPICECYNERMRLSRLRMCASLLASLLECGTLFGQTEARQRKALVAEAFAQAQSGQYVEAIEKYEEALRISPGNFEAEVGLAQAYRGVHNYDAAVRMLERAHREHPKSAAPLALLGDLNIELQRYAAAISNLAAALALAPEDLAARNRLAAAYRSKGDEADALAQVAKVLERDSHNALAYYTRAQIYAGRNQDALALPDAQKIVALQPQNVRGRVLLATILLRAPAGAAARETKQRCEGAVGALEPVRSEAASDPETLFLLSRAYRCSGRDADAQGVLEEFETASQHERTTKENQTQAKHLVQQANDLALKNDFAGSLALLQQAIVMDPTYGAAYSQLAKLYYSSGAIDRASDAIGQALSRDPYQPDYLYVYGKVLEKEGKFDEALAAFQKTALVNPKESDAFFEMGIIYEQRGEKERAIGSYKQAVELSPDDADYRRALASLSSPKSTR
jgi:tetratricopeptide (TPR) repeat protein